MYRPEMGLWVQIPHPPPYLKGVEMGFILAFLIVTGSVWLIQVIGATICVMDNTFRYKTDYYRWFIPYYIVVATVKKIGKNISKLEDLPERINTIRSNEVRKSA